MKANPPLDCPFSFVEQESANDPLAGYFHKVRRSYKMENANIFDAASEHSCTIDPVIVQMNFEISTGDSVVIDAGDRSVSTLVEFVRNE